MPNTPRAFRLKLVVFDVDGTLTRVESCWRFIHEKLGTWKGGGEINAELYFGGVLSYGEWAQKDASLWKGTPIEKFKDIITEIPFVNGIKEVFSFLRENGIKIALLTAGFSILAERIAEKFHVDCYVANELEVEKGEVTGRVHVKVSLKNKGELLGKILKRFNVKPEECLAVGDDETMIPVFKKVGLSIAFNPKTHEVEKTAKIVVKGEDLRKILPHIKKFMRS